MLQIDFADGGLEPIVVQLEVTNGANIGRISGGKSEFAFNVPLTPTNRYFFSDWQNKNSLSPNAPTLKDVLMQWNGATAKPAKLKLISFEGGEFKVMLILDNSDIIQQLRGVKVRDLGWGTSTAATTGGTPVDWGANATAYEACNFPVKWRDWLTGTDGKGVFNSDMWFGVSIYYIILKALQRITPTMPAISSNLIRPDSDWWFRTLILGFNPNAGYDEAYYRDLLGLLASHDAGLIEYNNCPAYTSAYPAIAPADCQKLDQLVDDFTTPNFDTGGNYNIATQTYTAPLTLKYRIRIVIGHNSWKYDYQSWPNVIAGEYRLFILINGVTFEQIPYAPVFFPNTAPGSYIEGIIDLDLTAGDTVEFYFMLGNYIDFANYDVRMNQCYVEILKPQDYVAGEAADLAGLIPSDVEVLDIFKALSNMFNLRWFYNSITDTLHVDPEHDWYDFDGTRISGFIGGEIDWTQRVDSGEIQLEPCREMLNETFTWEAAADATLKAMDVPRAVKAATGTYNTGRNDAKADTTNVEFPKLNHILDYQVQADDGAGGVLPLAQLPLFFPVNHNTDPLSTELFTDRISFIATVQRTDNAEPNGTVVNGSDGLATPILQACHFDHTATAIYGNYQYFPMLEFGDAVNIQGGLTAGLMKRFWLTTLASLRQGKRITAKMRVNALDLSTIDFRKFIRVGSILYVLESAKLKGEEGTVTLRQYIPCDVADGTYLEDSDVQTLVIYNP